MHLKWSLSSIGMNLKVVSVRSPNQRAWLRSLDMFLSRIGSFTEMPSGRERRDDDAEDTPNMGKEEKRKRGGETKRMKKRFWFHRGRRHHHPLRRPRMRERERGNDRGSPVHARRVREMGPRTLLQIFESDGTICRRNLLHFVLLPKAFLL